MTTPPTRVDIPVLGGLAQRVRMAIEADTDGVATLIRGMVGRGADPFVKPNSDGSWPKQTRSTTNPGTLFWLRQLTETELAPMPTAEDGFIGGVRGDLVFPLPEDVASSTMLFSDSFSTTEVDVPLAQWTGDAYMGGSIPTWVVDLSEGGEGRRGRVTSDFGLDLYNNVWLRAAAPALPTTGGWRASFTFTRLDPNHSLRMPLRAAAYNDDTNVTMLKISNSGGLIVAKVDDTLEGVATLGQAPFTAGDTRVVVEFDGAQVRVTAGGVSFTPGTVPTRLPRLPELVLRVPMWQFVSLRELTVETL